MLAFPFASEREQTKRTEGVSSGLTNVGGTWIWFPVRCECGLKAKRRGNAIEKIDTCTVRQGILWEEELPNEEKERD